MKEEESLEELKASVMIKLRNYKLLAKKKTDDTISYHVRIPRERCKALIWCIPNEGTVGIAIVKNLEKVMKENEIEKGILITSGKYTHAARMNAPQRNIELLPGTFPSFDIFKHELVPKHEILTPEEKDEVLARYRIEPQQLPQIKASDPTVKAIGAKAGDVLRIIRSSPTAGKHIAYRYVV